MFVHSGGPTHDYLYDVTSDGALAEAVGATEGFGARGSDVLIVLIVEADADGIVSSRRYGAADNEQLNDIDSDSLGWAATGTIGTCGLIVTESGGTLRAYAVRSPPASSTTLHAVVVSETHIYAVGVVVIERVDEGFIVSLFRDGRDMPLEWSRRVQFNGLMSFRDVDIAGSQVVAVGPSGRSAFSLAGGHLGTQRLPWGALLTIDFIDGMEWTLGLNVGDLVVGSKLEDLVVGRLDSRHSIRRQF